jgi:hypothetical protein
MSELEIKESDYMKRSIEFWKYMFSSSAALLLIIAWKVLSEKEFLLAITDNLIVAFLVMILTICIGCICWESMKAWRKHIDELKPTS